mgnify:CR=1 FL=1
MFLANRNLLCFLENVEKVKHSVFCLIKQWVNIVYPENHEVVLYCIIVITLRL